MIKYKVVDPREIAKCESTKKRLSFLTNGGWGRSGSEMIGISRNPEQCIFIVFAIDSKTGLIIGWCTLTPFATRFKRDGTFTLSAKNKKTQINTYVAAKYRNQGIGKTLVSKICELHDRASHTLSHDIYCYYDYSDSGKKMYDAVNKQLEHKALRNS